MNTYSADETPRLSRDQAFQIARSFQKDAVALKIPVALCGGYAMQLYGSDRQTKDIDFLAAAPLAKPSSGKLSFGGDIYTTEDNIHVDWIVRTDEQQSLYQAALDHRARMTNGLLVVAPEYLAVIKLLARRPKDESDLLFLLRRRGLVNRGKAHAIIKRLYGPGAFAISDDLRSHELEADLLNRREERNPPVKQLFIRPRRLVIHTVKRPRA
jgi:hypothetical protein